MTNIDDTLSRLAAAPVHSALAGIDDAVLTRLAHRRAQGSTSIMGLAAAVSLVVGVAGAALPSGRANAATVMPFGLSAALAPSSLLASN